MTGNSMDLITLDCPECWWLVAPDIECGECYGTGTLVVYCVRCCNRPADRYQDGEPICSDCETIKTCRCGEEWCRAEWCALPLVGPALTADGFVYAASLRNCTCDSTLACAVWLEQDDPIMRRRDRAMAAKVSDSPLAHGWGLAVRA